MGFAGRSCGFNRSHGLPGPLNHRACIEAGSEAGSEQTVGSDKSPPGGPPRQELEASLVSVYWQVCWSGFGVSARACLVELLGFYAGIGF